MFQSSVIRRVLFGAALAVFALVTAGQAQAADIPVTNTADSGTGSLRDAITTANATPLSSDRLVFGDSVSGTITLATKLPELLGPTEIVGPGAGKVTISGDDKFQILVTKFDLTVSGLTFSHGVDLPPAGEESTYYTTGGAIKASAVDPGNPANAVTIKDSVFTGNKAGTGGAVAAFVGSLTIENSEFRDNEAKQLGAETNIIGGGVVSAGAETLVRDSSFVDNKASGGFGGGLIGFSFGTGRPFDVSGSVFQGNTATQFAGLATSGTGATSVTNSLFSGNIAVGVGGGLGLNSTGTTTVSNVTVTGNKVGVYGAGILVSPSESAVNPQVNIDSATVTDNTVTAPSTIIARGAGLFVSAGSTKVTNSIVSANAPEDISSGAFGPIDPPNVKGSFNLIGNRTNADYSELVAGSDIDSNTPGLDPLADNGGPTMTMLPADNSPVVNKGSSTLNTDQRSLPRPIDYKSIPFSTAVGGNGADMGAVELQKPPTCQTDPSLCPPSNKFAFGKLTLNRKKGTATIQVKVPGAGKVALLNSKTVAAQSKTAPRKTTVKLTIKAKGKAAKDLRKKGRTRLKIKVKFTPKGGTPLTKAKTVQLAKKIKRKRR